jgi:hypothetical protein
MSLAVAIAASLGAIKSWQDWRRSDYEFYREGAPALTNMLVPIMRTYSFETQSEKRSYAIPNQKYNYAPIALLVFGVIAAGGYSEMTFRWKLAERAAKNAGPEARS